MEHHRHVRCDRCRHRLSTMHVLVQESANFWGGGPSCMKPTRRGPNRVSGTCMHGQQRKGRCLLAKCKEGAMVTGSELSLFLPNRVWGQRCHVDLHFVSACRGKKFWYLAGGSQVADFYWMSVFLQCTKHFRELYTHDTASSLVV